MPSFFPSWCGRLLDTALLVPCFADLAGVRRADWDAITYSDTNEEKHDVRSSEEVRFIKQAGKVA